MFSIVAKLVSSVASFLFPVFASYKALKTSDPSLLAPWLMYWVVLACALLFESWTLFILEYIPFYSWIRAGFLLYLIAPGTQGAIVLYQEHVQPFLQEHEIAIEDFISSAHDRIKKNSLHYLKRGLELLKQYFLGIPPQPTPPPSPGSLSYTQALIARFNVPNFKPATPPASATDAPNDFYTLLASAVSAATSVMTGYQASSSSEHKDLTSSSRLIPSTIRGAERMSFIAAQRERLLILLSALDKEAQTIKPEEVPRTPSSRNSSNMCLDGTSGGGNGEDNEQARPPSSLSGISKSRSELDFEKIEADEELGSNPGNLASGFNRKSSSAGSWMPWAWSSSPATPQIVETMKERIVASNATMGSPFASTGTRTDQGKSSGIDI